MANRSVNIYRKVVTPDNKSRFCRVITGGNNKVSSTKVEYQGRILEVSEGDFYLSYRNPKQHWERVPDDPKFDKPKAAYLARERKRAELAGVAAGLIDRENTASTTTVQLSLEDARDLYLSDIRRSCSEGTVDHSGLLTIWRYLANYPLYRFSRSQIKRAKAAIATQ